MRNRFAIFAAASLFALSPASSARASPNDPISEVKSVPTLHVPRASALPSIDIYDFNQKIEIVTKDAQGSRQMKKTVSNQRVDKFHFDDRSTGIVSAPYNLESRIVLVHYMPVAMTSVSILSSAKKRNLAPPSNDRTLIRSTQYPFTKAESLVRRRCCSPLSFQWHLDAISAPRTAEKSAKSLIESLALAP